MTKKTYALIDCDSFFCSCERVFRPDLKKIPVLVLSNNDGCVVSRTKEVKALGIAMGEPYFKIKDLCIKNNVAVFSSNFSLYTDLSRRVMNVLKSFSPLVEVYSVDEAFLDLSGIANVESYAREIKKTVEMMTKIPISIGIGPTKGICKVACYVAKRDSSFKGVVTLEDEKLRVKSLANMPVQKIWGIAKQRSIKLQLMGIKTALDFVYFKNESLIQKVLTKIGRQIQEELRGNICFPISTIFPKKKEIMSSRTFGFPVFDYKFLREAVASHAHEVSEELRMQKSVCFEVMVFIRSNPFIENSEQYRASRILRFSSGTSNLFKITKMAIACLQDIYRPGIEYKKLGVKLMGLQDDHQYLLGLFDILENKKDVDLMNSIDQINLKQGSRTIHSMACGTSQFAWYMNRKFKSLRYTTSWQELPIVKV